MLSVTDINTFRRQQKQLQQKKAQKTLIDPNKKYVTPAEYAELTGQNLQTVWRKCRNNELPACKDGGSWMIEVANKEPEQSEIVKQLVADLTKAKEENAILREKIQSIQAVLYVNSEGR